MKYKVEALQVENKFLRTQNEKLVLELERLNKEFSGFRKSVLQHPSMRDRKSDE